MNSLSRLPASWKQFLRQGRVQQRYTTSTQHRRSYRTVPFETVDPVAFAPSSSTTPCRFPSGYFTSKLPAFSKWFILTEPDDGKKTTKRLNIPHLTSSPHDPFIEAEVSSSSSGFGRISIPLSELCHHVNAQCDESGLSSARLYCAQATPPSFLLPDVPHPFGYLLSGGKGERRVDVYSQAIWLGSAASSRTPLHKDPNDNVFVQLSGKKRIRVFSPEHGVSLLEACGAGQVARQRLRMEDMMVGETAGKTDAAVWGGDGNGGMEGVDCHEVIVSPGDGVYIPKGWWHSVRGVVDDPETRGDVVASANWWFRVAADAVDRDAR